MARFFALIAVAMVGCCISKSSANAAPPDQEVLQANGNANFDQQAAAGFSTTPGPSAEALPENIAVAPAFGNDYAPDDQVQNAVGDVSFSMEKCPQNTSGEDQRVVRVQLSTPKYTAAAVVNTLLLKAVKYAWANCPQPFTIFGLGSTSGHFHYDVSEIDLYLPDGTKAFSGSLGMFGQGDQGIMPGREYKWQHLVNLARPSSQAPPVQPQGESPVAAPIQETLPAVVQSAATPASGGKGVGSFFVWVVLIGAVGAGFFVAYNALSQNRKCHLAEKDIEEYNGGMKDEDAQRLLSEKAEAYDRLEIMIKMEEIAGNPLNPDEVAMFRMFIAESWSEERQIDYILQYAKKEAQR